AFECEVGTIHEHATHCIVVGLVYDVRLCVNGSRPPVYHHPTVFGGARTRFPRAPGASPAPPPPRAGGSPKRGRALPAARSGAPPPSSRCRCRDQRDRGGTRGSDRPAAALGATPWGRRSTG